MKIIEYLHPSILFLTTAICVASYTFRSMCPKIFSLLSYGGEKPVKFNLYKRSFAYFYLTGIFMTIHLTLKRNSIAYIFHVQCCRRFMETIPTFFLPSSHMNFMHWIYGIYYYWALSNHFRSLSPSIHPSFYCAFAILSALQSLIHCLYMREKARCGKAHGPLRTPLKQMHFLTYITEWLIHFVLFIASPDLMTAANMVWVSFYVFSKNTINNFSCLLCGP